MTHAYPILVVNHDMLNMSNTDTFDAYCKDANCKLFDSQTLHRDRVEQGRSSVETLYCANLWKQNGQSTGSGYRCVGPLVKGVHLGVPATL